MVVSNYYVIDMIPDEKNTGSHTLIINDNNAHTDIIMSCSCFKKGKCSLALV